MKQRHRKHRLPTCSRDNHYTLSRVDYPSYQWPGFSSQAAADAVAHRATPAALEPVVECVIATDAGEWSARPSGADLAAARALLPEPIFVPSKD